MRIFHRYFRWIWPHFILKMKLKEDQINKLPSSKMRIFASSSKLWTTHSTHKGQALRICSRDALHILKSWQGMMMKTMLEWRENRPVIEMFWLGPFDVEGICSGAGQICHQGPATDDDDDDAMMMPWWCHDDDDDFETLVDYDDQTWYLSTNLRNHSFWPKKFTQKKHKSRQNQIRDKTA